ncbi:preprotein translocase subunit YajC [Vreelandella sulfidaeris]|uniref:Preprotein translocase subunit YajC n=1 Tax=Vreelandella sulfidaeris TaxID=115553 RepID=A0A365TJK7_9GAMM|nr:preprotein translocase subunit YajC [Halomonas sulfidaeris]RBI65778.1 preprotein translocase subunit YajC [Halomonas sulfidaeris]
MEWLIIVLILMFVIAPVMWLKPSPRQKRHAALRSQTSKQGVSIKLEKPPLHNFKGTMPAYRWHYPQEGPGPDFLLVRDSNASEALAPFHAGWRWRIAPLRPLPDDAAIPLKALLERLPQDALVVQSTPYALTLWWWESQTAERFATYLPDFQQLRNSLQGRADQPVNQPLRGAELSASPASDQDAGLS